MRPLITPTLALAAGLMASSMPGHCGAVELLVEVRSVRSQPIAVVTQQVGQPAVDMSLDSTRPRYHQALEAQGTTASWVVRYTLVARWQDARQQIYLRTTEAITNPISLRIFHLSPIADAGTLERIENLGIDLDALLEKYFVARDVYRLIRSPLHEVAIRAFKDWYDASYELTRQYAFIDRDDEVLGIGRSLHERAKTDPRVRRLLERITKPGYFGVMNAQLDTLEWRDVGMVERLQREGKYGQASKINDHFVSLYSQLTPAQQRAVTQFQGVNGSLLSDNARFLKTRSGM